MIREPTLSSPQTKRDPVVLAALAAVILLAIFMRLYALDRLPGINGDEAWYGVKVEQFAAGRLTEWRTPTGNLPGPLQLAWLALLHGLFAPSFWLLRLPAVISSITATALAYATARRFFGATAAIAALALMAALPANVAYARFGWDPSHSGLVVVAATWLALDRRLYLATLAFAFALWVHPTNVFAAPFLVLSFAGAEFEAGDRDRAPLRTGLFLGLLLAAVSLLTWTTSHGHVGPGASGVPVLAPPDHWWQFPAMVVQFLSGETAFNYLAGDGWGAARPFADGVTIALLAGLLAIGGPRLWPLGVSRATGVVAGWLASLGAFFLLAGPAALHPGEDRYALCLIVPTVMALAVLAGAIAPEGRLARVARLAAAALALAALGGFWLRYIEPLAHGRGGTHRAFWTGPVEPKQAAYAIIVADARGTPATIFAEDWWLYWPLAYLADGRATLVQLDDPRGASLVPRDAAYWVAYRGGALDRALERRGAARHWDIAALNRGEALRVWKTAPAPVP